MCVWAPASHVLTLPQDPLPLEKISPLPQTGRVKLTNILILPVVAVLCAAGVGCQKSTATNSADTTNAPAGYFLPSGPQPMLQTMKIYLGPETLNAELALTAKQQATGLMYRTNITDDTAMIFVLPAPLLPPDGFWMTNCPMSLSAAYIGPDGVIEEIHHLEKNDNIPVVATNDNIDYVLEVNDGWFARHNINTGMVITTEHGSLADTFRK